MNEREMLRDALKHEENAVQLYQKYAREAESERIREMFEQFAMNESWHAAALRAKLKETEA